MKDQQKGKTDEAFSSKIESGPFFRAGGTEGILRGRPNFEIDFSREAARSRSLVIAACPADVHGTLYGVLHTCV